ncbi:cytochrome P450 71A1-like [Ipomoea triloba]|uniref:cytochrome P450 71A1-like n=1 Tax=Ipomoea triloba TaxID=35885 RepID=UPI00125E8118|nr:cytochrome P450 71A1-like [Ipomoea triloba]
MELQQLVIAAVFIMIFAAVVRKPKKSPKPAGVPPPPPGPPGLPLIGNLHQFDAKNPHLYLTNLAKKYGPVISLKLGSIPVVVISSASAVKQALKTHDKTFSGRPEVTSQQKLSYKGLDIVFSQYNDHWKEMRKTCNMHLFSPKNVQSFRPIRQQEVSLMLKQISKTAGSPEPINLSDTAMSTAVDFICRSAFGRKYEGEERIKFEEEFHEAQALLVHFFVADLFPSLGWIDRLSGMTEKLEKSFREADGFAQRLVDEHLSVSRPASMEGDIIDVLLRLKKQQSSTQHLTFDHIKAVLLDILVAGTETIATTVVWAMTNLMMKPAAMEKVQAEIKQLVGNKHFVDEDTIQRLPYFLAVVKETLRLYPPTPLLQPRETTDKCTIEGYEIQAKSFVIVNAWAIGRDPEYWEDSEEFRPERFLNSGIDYKGQDFELIPFGAGRRICPGLNMGIASVEVILANLLYSFEWEMPPGLKREEIDTQVLPGITMQKKIPLCLLAKNSS